MRQLLAFSIISSITHLQRKLTDTKWFLPFACMCPDWELKRFIFSIYIFDS